MGKSTVQKASHCVWQIHDHIVFPVKYRKVLLEDDVVAIITEVTRGLAERYDMEFERLGCDRNHIHLLCSAHPKIVPWQIVRVFKSITGRELFRRKPALKKELWGRELADCRKCNSKASRQKSCDSSLSSNTPWSCYGDIY